MIKNILNCNFKYEDNKMYRFNKIKKVWTCCSDLKPRPKYIRIEINKKYYPLHRIIYKYFNEDWDITDISKDNIIDHFNNDTLDNRIENLRVLSNSQNNRNAKKRKNCINSKYIGVRKCSKNKWRAEIRIDGKKKHVGQFETELEAAEVYKKKYDESMNNI